MLIHDWLYIKELLSASLTLPIVMENFLKPNAKYKENRRANQIVKGANLGFYLITMIWFLCSSITGSFAWRMSISLVFLFMTLVLLWSICHINNLIRKTNTKINTCRVNLSLAISGVEVVSYSWLALVQILGGDISIDSNVETKECR